MYVYLQRLIEELEYRFEPWPVWLFNTEKAFNFDSSETNETKISALNIRGVTLGLPGLPRARGPGPKGAPKRPLLGSVLKLIFRTLGSGGASGPLAPEGP